MIEEQILLQEPDNKNKPKPYPVNKPTFKVQNSFTEEDSKYVITVEYKRLDSSNFRLLLDKEKSTKRITETLTKNRSRERLSVDDAHNNFFDAIVTTGWLEVDDEKEELQYRNLTELTIEQKIALNVKFLDCKAVVKQTVGAGKHDFLFERDGHMIIEFFIGDPENPIWKLLMKVRRPRQSRRSKFRDDFAYGITSRGGDLPITETYIDLSSGVRLFDEYFDTILNDSNYSDVAFLQNGLETSQLDHNYVEGNEEDRKQFLTYFNPHFKVEIAGAIISTFSKSGRES